MSEASVAATRLAEIMLEAGQILGVNPILLRCEWNLETVHVSIEDDVIVASDRGQTYGYLARNDDATFDDWMLPLAQSAVTSCDAELLDDCDEFSSRYVVRRALRTGESPAAVVAKVGDSIDRIFYAHLRADLKD